ncbi:hypothetical protein [Moorena sp. SIOASIH]|uniref:hypothetical protein n=1 Tax=Moorena sp. SIOASIH TaxID=2607817 RepID=UPI0025E8AF3A|nr:hypothetical protein [Moorena sp. SIOASIH]
MLPRLVQKSGIVVILFIEYSGFLEQSSIANFLPLAPYSLLPTPYSLLPTPYSLLPTPCSLFPLLNYLTQFKTPILINPNMARLLETLFPHQLRCPL